MTRRLPATVDWWAYDRVVLRVFVRRDFPRAVGGGLQGRVKGRAHCGGALAWCTAHASECAFEAERRAWRIWRQWRLDREAGFANVDRTFSDCGGHFARLEQSHE